jgi:hypothetical protein
MDPFKKIQGRFAQLLNEVDDARDDNLVTDAGIAALDDLEKELEDVMRRFARDKARFERRGR